MPLAARRVRASMTTPARPPASANDDARALRSALGAFATGVAIVTTRDAEAALHGLTVNSFASVSLDPPLALWSLHKSSHSRAAFEAAPSFAINVLGRHQADLARLFARPHADRFAGLALGEGLDGAPTLIDSIASFECRRVAAHDGGDHIVFVGRIDRFRADQRPPLVFSRGRFGGFSE
jgi:flavin reductase (DIM6/NTAB) family NADH-FMN oxidoreductase RutF